MAYAISENDAATAPTVPNGEDLYVQQLFLKGTTYYLYVHRFDIFVRRYMRMIFKVKIFLYNQI